MREEDEIKLLESLVVQGELYGREISEALQNIYLDDLGGYEINQVLCAMKAHRTDPERGRFFPKPSDIISKINGSAKGNATEAWPEVVKLASNSSEAFSEDPMTEAAVRALGGWRKIGQTQERDLVFLRKEFIEIYEGYLESPALVEKSQRLANTSTQRLASGPQRIGAAK